MQVHFTKSRLATLAKRPGGMWRGQAIAEAARLVEALREPAMDDIDALIGRLEIASTDRKSDPLAQMKEVQGLTDSLITLGGTFGLESLVEASKRLSDLAYAFRTRGEVDDKAIAVHVRAIRLFGPKGSTLPDDAAEQVLIQLRKVLQHFGVDAFEESTAGCEPE